MNYFHTYILIVTALFLTGVGCSPKGSEQQKTLANLETTQEVPENDSSDTYRETNWQPEKGQYYFSEGYYFTYLNEMIAEGEFGREGEFGFYLDPETGTILLERYLTAYSDEMVDYVIIHPEGGYSVGSTDEFGEKAVTHISPEAYSQLLSSQEERNRFFEDDFQAEEEILTLGANKYYPKSLEGKKYTRTFLKGDEVVDVYVADSPFPTTAFYLVNEVITELGLPVKWDYVHSLPEGKLVIKEAYTSSKGEKIGFELTSIMASEYHIQFPTKE